MYRSIYSTSLENHRAFLNLKIIDHSLFPVHTRTHTNTHTILSLSVLASPNASNGSIADTSFFEVEWRWKILSLPSLYHRFVIWGFHFEARQLLSQPTYPCAQAALGRSISSRASLVWETLYTSGALHGQRRGKRTWAATTIDVDLSSQKSAYP